MDKTSKIRLQNTMLIKRLEQTEMTENEFLKKMQHMKEIMDQKDIQKRKRTQTKEDRWEAKEY